MRTPGARFDAIYGRVTQRGLDHWADPTRRHPGEINHHDGGRGVYFLSNDGHFLEIITRPYGQRRLSCAEGRPVGRSGDGLSDANVVA